MNAKTETLNTTVIQRSIQVPKDIWDAAKCIPGGRTKFIIGQLASAVDANKSEIPKLRMEIEMHLEDIQRLEALVSAKTSRIMVLESEQENNFNEAIMIQTNIEQAVIETMRLIKEFRKELSRAHYKRLSDLSRTPIGDIESFIKEMKYRPTETQIREFFLR